MTRPSCISSVYSTVQPASCAAATIMPSYMLRLYRGAKARPRTWVSSVMGTTAQSSRIRSEAWAICGQVAENLRRRVLAHSLSTWTLTVPPASKRASEGSPNDASPTSAYTRTLVSKKTSVFVIGVAALEAITGGNLFVKLFTKLAQLFDRRLPFLLPFDLEPLSRGLDDLDLVAL